MYNINKIIYKLSGAQLMFGITNYSGFGVLKNINRGIDWLNKSLDNKEVIANFSLGFLYHEGISVKKDIEKSILLYKEASSFNIQYAKNNLGIIYKYGIKNKIQQNLSSAKVYFKEAIWQKKMIN